MLFNNVHNKQPYWDLNLHKLRLDRMIKQFFYLKNNSFT